MRRPTVFIHTNNKQKLGALVGAYSMKEASAHSGKFDVNILSLEETPHLFKRQGQSFLRKGKKATWLNEDLQSFSPLRRMIPQLMNFEGRAVVTDPDVFAVGDIYELLTMDMGDKAILCRNIASGYKNNGNQFYASSVMLLDCGKLKHWRWSEDIDAMFAGQLDYGPWIALKHEDVNTIGDLAEEWNSFDKLSSQTKLLHMTERSTQPWRTGLKIDFDLTTQSRSLNVRSFLRKILAKSGFRRMEQKKAPERYLPHPDPAQERLFFELFYGAIDEGYISLKYVGDLIEAGELRSDALGLLRNFGPLKNL